MGLDVRAAGDAGGELSCHVMILISKLIIARGDGAVKFDKTTSFSLPATLDETFPSDLKLSLAGCAGLQGSFVRSHVWHKCFVMMLHLNSVVIWQCWLHMGTHIEPVVVGSTMPFA